MTKNRVSSDITAERRRLLMAIAANEDHLDSREKKWSLASLSRALGRNPAYLQQYIHRQSPKRLPEPDRHHLAALLGIDEAELRPDTDHSETNKHDAKNKFEDGRAITIPFIDIQSAAGHASIIDEFEERTVQGWQFSPEILAHLPHRGLSHLRLITVRGDSMSPLLEDGDIILIDLAQNTARPAGIFVLDDGQGLVVKKCEILEKEPTQEIEKIRISSANRTYAPYRRGLSDVRIIGRVIWMARTF